MTITATLLLAFSTPAQNGFPPPEQPIRRAVEVRKAQAALGLKFTWREERENRDEKGRPLKPFTRAYDVIIQEGEKYSKLTLIDGKPPDDETIKKIQVDLEKERELRRKHAFMEQVRSFRRGPRQILRFFDNTVAGEDLAGGGKAWRVESEPKRGVPGPT